MKKPLVALLLVIIVGTAIYFFAVNKSASSQPDKIIENIEITTTTVNFSEIGVSIDVPSNLVATKDAIQNIDDSSKLDSYLFYIQYPSKAVVTQGTADFQIYGMFQFGLPRITLDQFNEIKNDTSTYAYTNAVAVNGIRGFEGKFNGERGNYFYQFFLDGQILKISISPATVENKMLAEKIIKSIKLIK